MILASQSPRRRQLLSQAGFTFNVIPANIDERQHKNETPSSLVRRLAQEKAHYILENTKVAAHETILAADTIVSYHDECLGKPIDKKDARRMLKMLSGNLHQVSTGWCILETGYDKKKNIICLHEHTDCTVTKVIFKPLSNQTIEKYLETNEPYDKAGAYGIQGYGGNFVDHIAGSYSNVVGLPIEEIIPYLSRYQEG